LPSKALQHQRPRLPLTFLLDAGKSTGYQSRGINFSKRVNARKRDADAITKIIRSLIGGSMASKYDSQGSSCRWLPAPDSQVIGQDIDSVGCSELAASLQTLQAAVSSAHWLAPPKSQEIPDRRGDSRSGLGRRSQPRYLQDEIVLSSDAPIVAETPIPVLYAAIKRMMDVMGALAGILALAPLFMIVAFFVKLDGGPIFFSQERVGLGGRKFKMWKFRSMVVNAEALKAKLEAQNESGGPTFKMKNDPRITPIGRFIRKYSIDELPQLWNVLAGDMAVVGPRPALPKEVASYKLWQARRLSVKPGLTCIWQTSGRSTIKFDDWMRMDMRYIKSQGVALDVKLITKTVSVVVRGDGAY
jgi:lipopolysaccharide/colanic/teichoic acid biosynthesis glycosyltransferase